MLEVAQAYLICGRPTLTRCGRRLSLRHGWAAAEPFERACALHRVLLLLGIRAAGHRANQGRLSERGQHWATLDARSSRCCSK